MAYRDLVAKWNTEADLSGEQALFERFLLHHKDGIVPDEAIAFLFRKAAEKQFFSVQLIRAYQTLASRGAYTVQDAFSASFSVPGSYKTADDGGCSPEECDTLVGDFVQEISSFGTNNPLFYAAYMIADFCCFRPFPYANLETSLLLAEHYLLSHRMAPLLFHESNRSRLEEAVHIYQEKETLSPLRDLLQEIAEETEHLLF